MFAKFGSKDNNSSSSSSTENVDEMKKELQRSAAELRDRVEEVKVLRTQIKFLKEQNQDLLQKQEDQKAVQSLEVEVVHKPQKKTSKCPSMNNELFQ